MMPTPQVTVGVSDAKTAKAPVETIATYSLGSCIGVCLHDKVLKIGGMLHFQLPESKLDANKAKIRPYMFADTGLTRLLEEMYALGARKRNLSVRIAGGATMQSGPTHFEIGKRNVIAVRKMLWMTGLMIAGADVGGEIARTLYMNVDTGVVTVKSAGSTKEL